MEKYKIGYTQGTFDMFHIGHLNIIKRARAQCENLIVGVNSDELVSEYKRRNPVIPQAERLEIIKNIKGVDDAFITETLDKMRIWNRIHFDAVFIGDDWKGNSRWEETVKEMHTVGAEVVFLSHTEGISSTILRIEKENMIIDE